MNSANDNVILENPYKKINVRFECREDFEEFARLIGQPSITPEFTQRIVFPLNTENTLADFLS